MASKQMEYYTKLAEETNGKVATYNDFGKQIETIKADAKRRIKSLMLDMKFAAKQIELNNEQLMSAGQPVVKFELPKKTKSD